MAHHEFDDVLFGDLADRANVHQHAVAQNSDSVRNLLKFFEPVRHINDRHTSGFQQRYLLEQVTDFTVRQHGRGFVQHQHTRVVLQVAGNLDHLLLSDTQLCNRRVRVNVKQANFAQLLCRLCIELGLVDPARQHRALIGNMTQQQVLSHRQGGDQAEFLHHHAHTQALGIAT